MSSKPLDDLARCFDALADEAGSIVPSDKPIDPDSPHERELGAERCKPADWTDLSRSVLPTVTVLAQSCSQHLRVLASALPAAGVIYPLQTLLRATLEQSLIAAYLVETSIDSTDRVCRYINYRLKGLHERRTLHNRTGLVDHSDEIKSHIQRICSAAKEAGHEIKTPHKGPPHISSQFPSTVDLARGLIKGQEPLLGEIAWRLLSAVSHGALPGLMQHVSVIGPGPDPSMFDGHIQASVAEIATWCASPFLSLIEMMDHIRWFIGVPCDRSQAEVNTRRVIERLAQLDFTD